jgi:general secretion pathway protein A
MAQAANFFDETRYLSFFDLKRNPFPVAPDDQNFYLSPHIDHILVNIVHGIVTRKGFIVLTGDIGLGKTTISRRIMQMLSEKEIKTSLVFHTTYRDAELIKEINRDFGLEAKGRTLADQMNTLTKYLVAQNRIGNNCAVIIDDAQNLDHRSLELVRIISNLEANQQKLVQILLIGQPELAAKLNSHELRQLKSRIIINEAVRPLTAAELETYLTFKLNVSGNSGQISLNRATIKTIHRLTKGNFRQVNILMDRCLYVAFLHDTKTISKKVVNKAHLDIVGTKPSWRRRWPFLVPAGALVLAVLLGLQSYSAFSAFSSNPVKKPVSHFSKPPQIASMPKDVDPESHPSAKVAKKRQPADAGVPTAVVDFLNAYKIADRADAFYSALRTDRFHQITEDIIKDTGYQLVRLSKVPEFIQKKYGILAYPSSESGQVSYYLLWRPSFGLKKFYYSYSDPTITNLQQKLATLHLYPHDPDGRVSGNLMSAVIKFQEQMKLPVTGYPDEATIFLLSQMEKRFNNSTTVENAQAAKK